MNKEQEQLWREEFEDYDIRTNILGMSDYDIREQYYLAACKKRQEEIDYLKNELSRVDKLYLDACDDIKFLADLVKRAKLWVESEDSHSNSCEWRDSKEYCDCGVDQWLKDAEEIGE